MDIIKIVGCDLKMPKKRKIIKLVICPKMKSEKGNNVTTTLKLCKKCEDYFELDDKERIGCLY